MKITSKIDFYCGLFLILLAGLSFALGVHKFLSYFTLFYSIPFIRDGLNSENDSNEGMEIKSKWHFYLGLALACCGVLNFSYNKAIGIMMFLNSIAFIKEGIKGPNK